MDDEAFLAELEKSEEEKVSPATAALERLHEVATSALPAREAALEGEADLDAIEALFEAGGLSQDERRGARLAYLRRVGSRPPAGEQAFLAELRELIDAGVLVERKP